LYGLCIAVRRLSVSFPTDGERENKYDKHTEKVMPLAKKEGWTVIDMKNDWKTIFPEQ
jgi:hypothetical protein